MKNVSDHLDASKKTELKQNLHALRKVSVEPFCISIVIYSPVPRLHAERVYGGELKRGGETRFCRVEGKPGFEAK